MNEQNLLNNIKKIIGNEYIGDDCAYLSDLGIVISQDSLVEDIHFKQKWYTPFQLGYKSAVVNISDILAAGAIPKYLSVALSLPKNIDDNFVTEFYKGISFANNSVKVIGGDITGSTNKIYISITAIGIDKNRNISSRKNAKSGYVIITTGKHGTSAAGLNELINNGDNLDYINYHLMPDLEYDFSKTISENVNEPYAMMDTSDGIADALFKIAELSGVKIVVDFNKINHYTDISKDNVLFGGEDYKLIAAIPDKYLKLLNNVSVIGYVTDFDGVRLDISGEKYSNYNELKVYNHFGDNNE